jgi:hypothetical protein
VIFDTLRAKYGLIAACSRRPCFAGFIAQETEVLEAKPVTSKSGAVDFGCGICTLAGKLI